MTAIVGLIHNGAVWLAGDRALAQGTSLTPTTLPKVWRSGEFVIGCSGDYSWLTAWLDELPPDAESWRPDSAFAYLRRVCLPAIRQRMLDAGRVGKGQDGVETCDGSALIGYAGELFEVNGNGFSVIPCAAHVAGVGCGADLAIGATAAQMGHGRQWSFGQPDPERVLLLALGIAERFAAYVIGPFDVVSTEARP